MMNKRGPSFDRREDSVIGSLSSRHSVDETSSPSSEYSSGSPNDFLPIQQPSERDYQSWAYHPQEQSYFKAMENLWLGEVEQKISPRKAMKQQRRRMDTSFFGRSAASSTSREVTSTLTPPLFNPQVEQGPGSRLGKRRPFQRSHRPSALNLSRSNGSTIETVMSGSRRAEQTSSRSSSTFTKLQERLSPRLKSVFSPTRTIRPSYSSRNVVR